MARNIRPGVTIRVKAGKGYAAKKRGVTITEIRVPIEEWGKLQGIVLREAVGGFGVQKGDVVLSLVRPDASDASLVDGKLSLVRRGAKRRLSA